MDFPLYAIRNYVSLHKEGFYLVIQGYKNRYVLDDLSLVERFPLYEDRRLELLRPGNFKPYKLYPLTQRIESLDALIKSGKTTFIDRLGKIVRWSKKTFTKVLTVKVRTALQNSVGHWRLWVDNLEHPFYVVTYNGEPYLQYVRINNIPTLYALLEDKKKDTRIKI